MRCTSKRYTNFARPQVTTATANAIAERGETTGADIAAVKDNLAKNYAHNTEVQAMVKDVLLIW